MKACVRTTALGDHSLCVQLLEREEREREHNSFHSFHGMIHTLVLLIPLWRFFCFALTPLFQRQHLSLSK